MQRTLQSKGKESAPWPPIPKALLERLEDKLPPQKIEPGADRDSIMFAAGKRALLDYLWFLHEEQHKTT